MYRYVCTGAGMASRDPLYCPAQSTQTDVSTLNSQRHNLIRNKCCQHTKILKHNLGKINNKTKANTFFHSFVTFEIYQERTHYLANQDVEGNKRHILILSSVDFSERKMFSIEHYS